MAGAFAASALEFAQYGLAVLPLGGDDGKVPQVKHATWKRPPGKAFLTKLSKQFPDANIGILCALSGVSVVDIDDPALTDEMIDRCGDTPLKMATPRGGVHLWYRHNGERSVNLRDTEGIEVDVKATGGLVVSPPSIRPSGDHAGKPYTLLTGSWDDIDRLPIAKPGSLPNHDETPVHMLQAVKKGRRNKFLLSQLLKQAGACDDFNALLDVARSLNERLLPPLTEAEVIKTVRSAWGMEESGENWAGQEARVVLGETEWGELMENTDALLLHGTLKISHGSRYEPFAICPKPMAAANVIPGWGPKRYANARRWLIDHGFLLVVHEGGKYRGDEWLFRLSPTKLSPSIKGAETAPNINNTLPPFPRTSKGKNNE